jgi:hypothetical protein
MAFIPGTPKEESWNCPGLDSRDFGSSSLSTQTSDWDEVWSKLVTLFKSFPTVCRTPSTRIGIGSIPDFLWSGVKLSVWLPALSFNHNLCYRCPNGSCEAIFDIYISRPFNNTKNTSTRSVLSQPHFGQVWGVKLNTPKVGDLESSGTPECLGFDNKAQNTSHWGVLGVIGKVLKRRYRKWPLIGHLDIYNPSYGQKKGRELNW